MNIFEDKESGVRSYCRKYTTVFTKALNSELFDETGKRYIDFFAVAGSMNYGHNNPAIKKAIIEYLSEDNVINSLDMYTSAKAEFLTTFNEMILKPRNFNYKIMCCGPTGTNAVEAALKLARKNTKRRIVFAFSGAFHGMSLGSLALTTDKASREGAGVPLENVTFIPYEGDFDSIKYIRWILSDDHSGVSKPAAIILETIQAEGGIKIASVEWLKEIRSICDEFGIILIVDDVQVGNGRSGKFFSFERAGIIPDMVVLSKSISGFGNPMALLLIKPEFDIFSPGEHNGTFRGNQLSFVGATAGIKYFCSSDLMVKVNRQALIIKEYLSSEIQSIDSRLDIRGIGFIWGIDFNNINPEFAIECVHKAFDNNLICEVAGRNDGVLKIMPPLSISDKVLLEGLGIIKNSIHTVLD